MRQRHWLDWIWLCQLLHKFQLNKWIFQQLCVQSQIFHKPNHPDTHTKANNCIHYTRTEWETIAKNRRVRGEEKDMRMYSTRIVIAVDCLSEIRLVHVCTMVYLCTPSATTKTEQLKKEKWTLNSANYPNEFHRLAYFHGAIKKAPNAWEKKSSLAHHNSFENFRP